MKNSLTRNPSGDSSFAAPPHRVPIKFTARLFRRLPVGGLIGRFLKSSRVILAALIAAGALLRLQAATVAFTGAEQLGKPTDTSIAINVIPQSDASIFFEYGTVPGVYTGQTATNPATANQPYEAVISGLQPDTRYYYRLQSAATSEPTNWVARGENTFHTQRSPGSTFVFDVIADTHAQYNAAQRTAMTNVLNDQPDFLLDLGDTFMLDGLTSQSAVNSAYVAARNLSYFGKIGPSVPIFLASGNHENEEGWNLDDKPFSIAIGSVLARKLYYPTPIPDSFYSGNTDPLTAVDAATYGDQYREDYYAWTWGDALFVVIDEFQYTTNLPYTPTAGEGTDDVKTGDQWSWTLGAQQFNWLKQTIQNSHAKYKFVFSHNLLGGITNGPIAGAEAGYVRGGGGAAANFEWGGNNFDGTPGFATHRDPVVFGTKPIHQLFVENGVSADFHGHDHQYVYETRDGVVYQAVPSPSLATGFDGIYTQGNHGAFNTIKILPNTGHLRVTVTPTNATVDYVSASSTSGTVNYSYSILPNDIVTTNYTITASADANGTISPSGAVSVVAGNDQRFTINASSGYAVSDVLVDSASVGAVTSYTFTNVQTNHTISASFVALPSFPITANVDANGAISPSGVVNVVVGSNQSFTISANSGYAVSDVLVDSVSAGAVTSYTFTNVQAAHTISASFVSLPAYTITASAGSNGTISPSGATNVFAGSSQSFTISANSGYAVSDVLVDSGSVGAVTSYTFTNVQATHTISASFVAAATGVVELDGAVSTGAVTNTTSNAVALTHTTGTGDNRLTLVGISWNANTAANTVTNVIFTPNGGTTTNLTLVRSQISAATTYRYAAIFALTNPPGGQTGVITAKFSSAISAGVVIGTANFKGVDQTAPLGASSGTGAASGATISTSLTGLQGNELVFDTVFLGGAPPPALTASANQTTLWNINISNARGVASIRQVASSSVTNSWTSTDSTRPWAIVAVPIHPAAVVAAQPSFETWQLHYFGGTNFPEAAATADPDGSGVNNWTKFQAGFNPTNNAAYLHFINITKSNNDLVIAYLGANGDTSYPGGPATFTNVLEFADELAQASFAGTAMTNVFSGGNGFGTNVVVVVPGGTTNADARFYRVRVLVPPTP